MEFLHAKAERVLVGVLLSFLIPLVAFVFGIEGYDALNTLAGFVLTVSVAVFVLVSVVRIIQH